MRLTRRPEPFDYAERIVKLKLDGFRALAYLENSEGRLVSRNGNFRILS
jgi:ATP-dependent DNA ligase